MRCHVLVRKINSIFIITTRPVFTRPSNLYGFDSSKCEGVMVDGFFGFIASQNTPNVLYNNKKHCFVIFFVGGNKTTINTRRENKI